MKSLIDRAKALALELPNVKGFQRVACIISDKRGRILATGVNDYTCTHPLQKRLSEATGFNSKRCYVHAELSACIKLKPHHKAYRATVVRVGRKGDLLPSQPCPSCAMILKMKNIQVLECTL